MGELTLKVSHQRVLEGTSLCIFSVFLTCISNLHPNYVCMHLIYDPKHTSVSAVISFMCLSSIYGSSISCLSDYLDVALRKPTAGWVNPDISVRCEVQVSTGLGRLAFRGLLPFQSVQSCSGLTVSLSGFSKRGVL